MCMCTRTIAWPRIMWEEVYSLLLLITASYSNPLVVLEPLSPYDDGTGLEVPRSIRQGGQGGVPAQLGSGQPLYCEEMLVEEDGYNWPMTEAGTVISGACLGYEKATRECSVNGVWAVVMCNAAEMNPQLLKLQEQIYGDTTPLNETASQFRELTANLSRLPTPIADVYLLQLMLERSIGLPPSEFITLTQDLLGAVDNMLEKEYQLASINYLDEMERVIAGSTLLQTLDNFVLTTAYLAQSLLNSNFKNLRIERRDIPTQAQTDPIIAIQDNRASVTLPPEVFQTNGTSVQVAAFLYDDMTGYLAGGRPNKSEEMLVSPVVSTALRCGQLQCDSRRLESPVIIRFNHSKQLNDQLEGNDSVITTCVYWEFIELGDPQVINSTTLQRGYWGEKGCVRDDTLSDLTSTVCKCSHLTHFAILLSPRSMPLLAEEDHVEVLGIISYVFVPISLVAMVLTCATFISCRSLWTMRNYIHINLCTNLFIAQLIFIVGVDKTDDQDVCSAIAVILHYFFLVTFMWMLMEGVILYVALVRVFAKNQGKYIIAFTVISYGLPLVYMMMCILFGFFRWSRDKRGYGYPEACWLRSDTNFVWTFIAPVILIILINCGFIVMVLAISCRHYCRQTQSSKAKSVRHWMKVVIPLVVIMGITWILGIVIFSRELLAVAYIYTILIALQGLIIFILFVPLSKTVRETYWKWWQRKVARSDLLNQYLGDSQPKTRRLTQETPVLPSHTSKDFPKDDYKNGGPREDGDGGIVIIANPKAPPLSESKSAMSPSDMSLRTMVNKAAQGQETLEEYNEDLEEMVTPL